jgi:hypothetical protein
LSVLYDSLWWWRAEFGGGGRNPYLDTERVAADTAAPLYTNLSTIMTTEPDNGQGPAVQPEEWGPTEVALDSLPDVADWQLMGITDWDWQEMLAN